MFDHFVELALKELITTDYNVNRKQIIKLADLFSFSNISEVNLKRNLNSSFCVGWYVIKKWLSGVEFVANAI